MMKMAISVLKMKMEMLGELLYHRRAFSGFFCKKQNTHTHIHTTGQGDCSGAIAKKTPASQDTSFQHTEQ